MVVTKGHNDVKKEIEKEKDKDFRKQLEANQTKFK